VRESAHLSLEHRRTLDAEMCADLSSLDGKGNKAITARAKEIAYRLDPHAVVDRAAKAETERTVTIRPAPDAMAYLTVLAPMARGVGMYAALKRQADSTFDDRSRGQIMADAAYERLTGRAATTAEPVAVNIVISDESLLGGDEHAAVVDGYGPIPAEIARRLVTRAVLDKQSRATLRRLYRHPRSGGLLAMESRSRRFPAGLAKFIGLRDQTCRTPYCDAPIRHRDHAVPRHRGGPTSALNGLGECERCNYVKEASGWHVCATDENGTHTAHFTTPTGMYYRSTAPPLPGAQFIHVSELEVKVGIALTDLQAA
jgi:hypothetical protein